MRQIAFAALSLCLLLAGCADSRGETSRGSSQDQAPTQDSGKGIDPLAKAPELRDPPAVVDSGTDHITQPSLPDPEPDYPLDGTDGGDMGGQPVPEPSTLLLVGTGLAGVALLRRRRRSQES